MARARYVAPAVGFVGFLAGTMTSAALTQAGQTQQAPPPVVSVDFFKVPPGQEAAYLQLEREVWMPVHRDRVRRGKLRSWSLFTVQYPSGSAHEYGYLTVNIYDSLGSLDAETEPEWREMWGRIHPRMSLDSVARRTFAARQLVSTELWRRLEHVER